MRTTQMFLLNNKLLLLSMKIQSTSQAQLKALRQDKAHNTLKKKNDFILARQQQGLDTISVSSAVIIFS